MGAEKPSPSLEEIFKKKEDDIRGKEKKETEREQPQPLEIITEQEVTAKADKAKKEIEETFLSDESKGQMLKALNDLIERQKAETEKIETESREKLIVLFNKTKEELENYKTQPEVKEIYDPLSKLFNKKKEYLTAINLDKYGLTDEKDKGYWATIQKELESAQIGQEDVKKVQTILGLDPDGKIGPKTIDATWEMLTGEDKQVANVIREKGKTIKADQKLVDAIIAKDEKKEDAIKNSMKVDTAKTAEETPQATNQQITEGAEQNNAVTGFEQPAATKPTPVETGSVQKQVPRTTTEVLKKDDGGWKEEITGSEWNEILRGLNKQKQPVSTDMKKLVYLATGIPEFSIPNELEVSANFDPANCGTISKSTIEIAKEMTKDKNRLVKVEKAMKEGSLPKNIDVPNPKVGSVMVAYDPFVNRDNRMTVFTETGPKEVKSNGTFA